MPRLKTLVQELSTLQVEFVAFKTSLGSLGSGVRVRSEVDRPEAASQASNSSPELAQQPESPAQVRFLSLILTLYRRNKRLLPRLIIR